VSLIEHFLTGSYQVTRHKGGVYSNGFYVPGPEETICMQGSLQPTNARELKLPEEGNRLRQFWRFYSDQPLLVNNTRSLADSDIVTIDKETYKVMSVEKWQGIAVDLPYYKAILYREPEQ
jgi:hypothetical protein